MLYRTILLVKWWLIFWTPFYRKSILYEDTSFNIAKNMSLISASCDYPLALFIAYPQPQCDYQIEGHVYSCYILYLFESHKLFL